MGIRAIAFLLVLFVFVAGLATVGGVRAQDDAAQATISALQTQVSSLQTSVAQSATPTPLAATTTPAGETRSPFLGGDMVSMLPAGEAGEISVVAVGAYDRGQLPIVVRNNTANTFTQVNVAATVKDKDGNLVAAHAAQGAGLVPFRVEPGQLAFGSLYFGSEDPYGGLSPSEVTIDFTAHGNTPGREDYSIRDFEIVEATARSSGDVVVGIARSLYVETPAATAVAAACFDHDARLTGYREVKLTDTQVHQGDLLPFQVEVTDCFHFLIAAYGYNGWT